MRRSTVLIELARDAALSRDLAAGGVFVPGCTLRMAEECELVVCGAHRRVSLPARVVWVDEQRGAGLELIGFSTAMRAQIAELAAPGDDDLAVPVAYEPDDDHRTVPVATRSGAGPRASYGVEADDSTASPATLDAPGEDLAVPVAYESDEDHRTVPVFAPGAATGDATGLLGSDPAPAISEADAAFFDVAYPEVVDADEPAGSLETTEDDGAPLAAGEGATEDEGAPLASDEPGAGEPSTDPDLDGDASGDPGAEPRSSRNLHERLRGMTLAAQIKLATSGDLHERIVLERLYGKNVWDTLLRNPRLTAPEVSRIARYGTLPRVLLEIILGNGAWLAVPEVRRALLANPRLGTDQILKVLRLVPKHELRLAAVQTAYPHAVRNAAKLLLRGE
ncbi:MAG: hypothetical protein E6J90_44400 [Deltaproteobacteria bacterium]|nr:MAG: hypothetical protein E6J91_38650 [Deltaproteobacteria bacterium]TMQ07075.1 MAG: hypothetical protein E6J90_44400 [Deltaproteobacteria bacterium]